MTRAASSALDQREPLAEYPRNGLRLLDLFSGAGGCAVGYHRAGFDVVGVDINPQPRYPFEFHQSDALEYVAAHGSEFDVIHASPPCQVYSATKSLHKDKNYPDLVAVTREVLIATRKPYIIENVPGSPLINPIMLCGTMFGLRVIRHRLFECQPVIWWPPAVCCHDTGGMKKAGRGPSSKGFWSIAGKGGGHGTKEGWAKAMNIDWMTLKGLSQAIPPAYTEWLGKQMLKAIGAA